MGVAVLPPQDFLRSHQFIHRHTVSPANKPRRNPNPNPNPNPRSNRRRRSSPSPPPGPAQPDPKMTAPVRILKRGESLSPPPKPGSTRPESGPDGFYAGSGFVTSPPPSELPLPAFFTRRSCGMDDVSGSQEMAIASELRRVLKLC